MKNEVRLRAIGNIDDKLIADAGRVKLLWSFLLTNSNVF